MTAPDRDRTPHNRSPRSLSEGVARFVVLPALLCGAYFWQVARDMSPQPHAARHVVAHRPHDARRVVAHATHPSQHVVVKRSAPVTVTVPSARYEVVVPSAKARIWRDSKITARGGSEPLYVMVPKTAGQGTSVYTFRDSKAGSFRRSGPATTVVVAPTTLRAAAPSVTVIAGTEAPRAP